VPGLGNRIVSTTEQAEAPQTGPACKLCQGATTLKFVHGLLEGQLEGRYFQCERCEMLQSDHLDSLGREPLEQIYSRGAEHDLGMAWRQWCISERLFQLARLRIARWRNGKPVRALDLGGGSGFCVSFMQHKLGWDAYGYDLFTRPAFAANRFLKDWDTVRDCGPFDLILATEVFEHFRDPARELADISEVLEADRGLLFVTTERFDPALHQADWTYLVPHTGQHVCFYGDRTFDEITRQIGGVGWTHLASDMEWLIYRNADGGSLRPLQINLGAKMLSLGTKIGFVNRI
jgi:SAM-dependent methyltransferase